MKDCNFLERVLPYPTEGEDDMNLIDLDLILNSGVGNDYTPIDNGGETGGQKVDKIVEKAEATILANSKKEVEEREEGDEGNEDNLTLLQGLNSDTLSIDQKELRDEILTKFNGFSIDENGNILDKDGKVIADFDKVDKFINAEPIFDSKGNQIDEEGKVLRTKAQVEFSKSAIAGVISNLPYKLEDEKGNPIIYDDTLEGYTKLAKDIGRIEAVNQYESLIASNPELTEVAKHLLSGGKLDDFKNPVDYTKIDTKKLTANDKLELIKKSFITSGVDSDSASDMIDLIKEKGDTEIDKRLGKAIGILDNNQKLIQEERDIAYQNSIKEENDNIIRYWGQVKQVIDKGKFGNIDIPKDDQVAFFKYLSTPVDDEGNSQETLDNNKQGLESELMMRYYRYKGYNLEKIINKEKNKDKVFTLRERINKSRKSNSSNTNTSTSKNINPGDVSLDVLLNS